MADYLIHEEDDGHFILEEGTGDLILEDGNPPIDVPFIAATTVVYSPTIAAVSDARVSQAPVEVLISPDPDGRISQLAVEVLVLAEPDARLSQLPVEVLQRVLYETVMVVIWD